MTDQHVPVHHPRIKPPEAGHLSGSKESKRSVLLVIPDSIVHDSMSLARRRLWEGKIWNKTGSMSVLIERDGAIASLVSPGTGD